MGLQSDGSIGLGGCMEARLSRGGHAPVRSSGQPVARSFGMQLRGGMFRRQDRAGARDMQLHMDYGQQPPRLNALLAAPCHYLVRP